MAVIVWIAALPDELLINCRVYDRYWLFQAWSARDDRLAL